jgi:hypothetical protein
MSIVLQKELLVNVEKEYPFVMFINVNEIYFSKTFEDAYSFSKIRAKFYKQTVLPIEKVKQNGGCAWKYDFINRPIVCKIKENKQPIHTFIDELYSKLKKRKGIYMYSILRINENTIRLKLDTEYNFNDIHELLYARIKYSINSFYVTNEEFKKNSEYLFREMFVHKATNNLNVIARSYRSYRLRVRLPVVANKARIMDMIRYRPGTGIKYFEAKNFFENKEWLE